MTFHPFIHLKVGDAEVSQIPPEFIHSITYKSSIEALSTLDFEIIDPAYTDVEKILILSDTSKEPILFRFGYIDPNSGQVTSNWLQSRLIRYTPELTNKGMRIVASCLVDVGLRFVNAKTATYSGRISAVVKKIASDLGLESEIEETNDDINEANPANRGAPTEWPTKNMPLLEFIRNELLNLARSKTGKGNYYLYVTGAADRLRKPKLHFHTQEFPDCPSRRKPIKKFRYLANQSDAVLAFKPDYNSVGLGNLGGSQVIMRAMDPKTKQFVSSVHNDRNHPDYIGIGEGTKSNTEPLGEVGVNEDTSESQAGVLMVAEVSSTDATNKGRNIWTLLKSYSLTAALDLVGLPDTSDIEANDLIQVDVLIPNAPGELRAATYQAHWSGGLYLVAEAIHQIAGQYTVTCQLRRDYSQLGSKPATTAKLVPPNPERSTFRVSEAI